MATRKRSRRRAAWALILLAAPLVGSYAYLTDPERLRATALGALARMGVTGVDIAHVTYAPTQGLRLHDIVLARPRPGAPPDNRLLPPLLRIERMTIVCDPLALLFGRVRPTGLRLDGVALAVLCDTAPGADSWTLMPSHLDADQWDRVLRFLDRDLPPLRIDRADLQLLALEHGDVRVLERLPLQMRGHAAGHGYTLAAEAATGVGVPLAQLDWWPADRSIDVSVDWAGIEALGHILPPRIVTLLAELHVTGQVRVEHLRYRLADRDAVDAESGLTAAEFRLRGGSCALPVEASGGPDGVAPPARPEAHFLRVHDAALGVTYQRDTRAVPGRLRLRLDGRLNDASVSGALVTQARVLGALWNRPAEPTGASEPPFSLDDVVHGELLVRGLELPTPETAPAFVESPQLPRALHTALHHYEPRGRVDVALYVLPAPAGPAVVRPQDRIELVVSGRGARCRYYEFPYAFDDVRGRVRFAQGRIFLEDICGRHGGGTACLRGEIFSTDSFSGFELAVRGETIALQRDLYQALPASYRQLWESAAPIGTADVVAYVGRPHGTPESGPLPPRIFLESDLLGGSVRLAEGRRIDHIDGRLTVADGQLLLHDLHGYDGDTAVRLDGRIDTRGGGSGSDVRFTLAGQDIAYDVGVRPDADGPAQSIRFAGRADVWGRVADPIGGERGQHLAVRINGGRLTGLDPNRPWSVERGWVMTDGPRRELRSFRARQGAARLAAHGRLPVGDDLADPLALELEAAAPALDVLLPQFVPAAWMHVARSAGLSGAGRVHVRLSAGGGPSAAPTARVDVRADRMRAEALPLPLRDVQAELTLAPGSLELHSAQARLGDGTVRADARGQWGDEATQVTLAASLDDLTFTDELVQSLPTPLRDLLLRLAPVGQFDAYFSRVHFTGGEHPTWQIEGRVPLRAESVRLGLDVTDLEGVLTGTCTIDAEGRARVEADVRAQRARLAGRQVRDLRGTLVREPDDAWVRLVDLHADLCGGQALGFVSFDPGSAQYELSVTLRDVLLSELLPRAGTDAPEDRASSRRGRLDGEVHLTGTADAAASRRGSGTLRLRGAPLLQTPVLASVAQAQGAPGGPLPETADVVDVRFLWEGRTLRLLRVDLRSEALRMVGEGSWNLDDDTIRLTLVSAHPEHLARVPLLTDLVESAGRELVQYEVEGKLSKPRVTVRPLYKLDDTLRALLGAE